MSEPTPANDTERPDPADAEKDAILRDERQTERQAPGSASPGEPAGGE